MKSVAEKMGVKDSIAATFINADAEVIKTINFPALNIKPDLNEKLDFILWFVISQAELKSSIPKIKKSLKEGGMLWISWPKSGQKNTDLNIKKLIEIVYNYGLVESKSISIDSVWSALKFTFPIVGKTYNNSYGNLKLD